MKNTLKKLFSLTLALLLTLSVGSATIASAASVAKVTSLQAYNIDDDEINLKWKKVSGAEGYAVYIYSSNGWKSLGTTKKTSFEADDLLSAKQYKFRVRAYDLTNGKKTYGAYSSVLTSATAPDEVEGLKVTGKTTSSVSLSWAAEKRATGYQVYVYSTVKKKYVKKASVKTTKATVKNLISGKTYKFKVRAYYKPDGKAYFGEFSDVVKTTTKGKTTTTNKTTASTLIGTAKAGTIALNHAKLQKSQVREYECKLDKENGIQVYEVEFTYGGYEYEYEVNAKTGKIISVEKTRD